MRCVWFLSLLLLFIFENCEAYDVGQLLVIDINLYLTSVGQSTTKKLYLCCWSLKCEFLRYSDRDPFFFHVDKVIIGKNENMAWMVYFIN